MNKALLLAPRGSVSAEDKAQALECGFCIIECDEPWKIIFATPSIPTITGDEVSGIMASVISEMASHEEVGDLKRKFGHLVAARVSANVKKRESEQS